MKHLLLILYFISYTSGIGAITLAEFYYIKTKNLLVKYIIMTDIFFTILLFFDNFNFYTDVFISLFPYWLQIIKIGGLMLSSVGMIYFFTISVCLVIETEITKRKKVLYFTASVVFLTLCTSALYILYSLNLISQLTALHSGFFLTNIFTSIGSVYNMLLIIKNWHRINNGIKQFFITLVVLTTVITPLSIISNIAQYWNIFNIPVAYSPIGYFLVNLSAITCAAKYLHTKNSNPKISEESVKNICIEIEEEVKQNSFEELARIYNLTPREIEIATLIVNGLSNQEIGETLFISTNTARNHIYNIFKKIGIKNRYELISLISIKNK